MKRKRPDSRNALSALRLSLALSLATLIPLVLYGSAPSWWSNRGVLIEQGVADDYAPANQGQLKSIAKAAVTEMDAKLPGGAGETLHQLIASWSNPSSQTNDFAPLNLGQLKNVAKSFYDRLISIGLATEYPWTNSSNASDDFASANIGQVKKLFSFELPAIDPLYDGDHNGLPDAWEHQYFGETGVDPNGDPDGDGISTLQEYLNHTDPTDFFNDMLTGLAITGGGDQRGNPGTLLPIPVSIRVNNRYGYGIADAPVTVMIERGSARLLSNPTGTSPPSVELSVRANAYDNDGYLVAQIYILLPQNPDVTVIRASAQGGGRSVSVLTTATAIDQSLAAPTNLVVAATSPSSARLTWVTENNTSATTIQVSIDEGKTWITLGAVAAGMTQATVTALTPNQKVRFRLFSGGTASDGNTSFFALPDPSTGPPPPPPSPDSGGGTTESVDTTPLRRPVMEIETASIYRSAFGFPGLLDQGGPYRDMTVVITSEYIRNDGVPDPFNGTTTVKQHWQRSEDGGSAYHIDTTEIQGGGGYVNSPWTTVLYTDTVLRQEGAPFQGWTGGSSRTVSLTNLYTAGELEAEGAALIPAFGPDDDFAPPRGYEAYAFFRRRGGYQVRFLKYRFKVNADPNLVVLWDIQFTPDDGGPVQHDIQSWSSDGSTVTPTYLLDPRTRNGGKEGTHNVVLISAELMVDGNRDNEMSFDDPEIYDKDQTAPDKPYRFWVNDDDDGAAGDPGDHVPVVTPDYADGVIRSPRDLEDFSRLQISSLGLEEALEKGSITAAFEWRQTSATPRIKLYRAVSDGTDYLTSVSTATSSTLSPFRDTLGEVVPGVPLFMPRSFWVSASQYANVPNTLPVTWLLFEGSGEGSGQLILSFWKDGHRVGNSGGTWIDLKNIKTMYHHQVLGGPDPWVDQQFQPAVDEQREVIIFVHGWRLSPSDTANFAETMFKRVWWRGFKGRFAAVRWDTYYNSTDHGWVPYAGQAIDVYLSKYNDSEHNAWMSGPALTVFVNSLPSDYTKHIVAHSMGNVVTGSALQRGMAVDTYALLNAAIPAACYDDRSDLQPAPMMKMAGPLGIHLWDTQTTPDDDPDPLTRRLAYRGRLMNVSGNLVSFFLPNDFATSYAWELNNVLTKPPLGLEEDDRREFGLFSSGFNYIRSAPPGQKLTKGGNTLTDPDEAEPFACRTWAKAVGAEPNTRGKLSGEGVNMGTPAFGGSTGLDTEHSGEFDRAIQAATPFYKELLNQFGVEQTR